MSRTAALVFFPSSSFFAMRFRAAVSPLVRRRAVWTGLALASLAACNGENGPVGPGGGANTPTALRWVAPAPATDDSLAIDLAGTQEFQLAVAPLPTTASWPQPLRWRVSNPALVTLDSLTGRLRILAPGEVNVTASLARDPSVSITRRLRLRNGAPLPGTVLQLPSGQSAGGATVSGALRVDPAALGGAIPAGSRLQLIEPLPGGQIRTWLDLPLGIDPVVFATDAIDRATGQPRMLNGTYTMVVRVVPPVSVGSGSPPTTPDMVRSGTRESPRITVTVNNPNRLWMELLTADGGRTSRDANGGLWRTGDVRARVGLVLFSPTRPLPSGTRLQLGTSLSAGGARSQQFSWAPEDPSTLLLTFSQADSASTGVGGYEFQPQRLSRLSACGGTEPMPSGLTPAICDAITLGERPVIVLPQGATGWSAEVLGPDYQPLTDPAAQRMRLDNRGPAPQDPSQRFRLSTLPGRLPGFPMSGDEGWVRGSDRLSRLQTEGGALGVMKDDGVDGGRAVTVELEQQQAGTSQWRALDTGADLGPEGTTDVVARLRLTDALGNMSVWPVTDGQEGRPRTLGRSDGAPTLVRRGGLGLETIHRGSVATLPLLQLESTAASAGAPPVPSHAWVRLWTWNSSGTRQCVTSTPSGCGWSIRSLTDNSLALLAPTAMDGRYEAEVISASRSGVPSRDTIRLNLLSDGTAPSLGSLLYDATAQRLTVRAADGAGLRTIWGGLRFEGAGAPIALWIGNWSVTGASPFTGAPLVSNTARIELTGASLAAAVPQRMELADPTGAPRATPQRAVRQQLLGMATDWADQRSDAAQTLGPGGPVSGTGAAARGITRAIIESAVSTTQWSTQALQLRVFGAPAAQPAAIYWLGRTTGPNGQVERVLLQVSTTSESALVGQETRWRAPTHLRTLLPWAGTTVSVEALLVWNDGESLLTPAFGTPLTLR